MDKMKIQDAQLMQACGVSMSTNNDWSTVTGNTPQPTAQAAKAPQVKGANRPSWQGLQIHKSGTIYTHSYAQTNKHMYNRSLLDTFSSIDLFCNQSYVCNVHKVNTTLPLATNAGVMMTNLNAELPGHSAVWFAMTNVLRFGNITKQYPVQYLQESDTFQVQLSDQINIFGCEQVDNL